MLDERSPKELVEDAEDLAQALLKDSRRQRLSFSDLIQVVEITLRLLKATYPGDRADTVMLTQMAEAAFSVVAQRPEWVH